MVNAAVTLDDPRSPPGNHLEALRGVPMILTHRLPSHPGEILRYAFLEPLELSQVALARDLGIPVQRVNELVNGKRGITAETAWKLSRRLETSPEFWMNLQTAWELARARDAA